MNIRKATKKDFGELIRLRKGFYLDSCRKDVYSNPSWSRSGLPIATALVLKRDNAAIFVAEDKGRIIGYIGCEIKKQPLYFKYRNRGEIYNLYVRKENRGRGIGTKLMRTAFKWFKSKKIKWANLWVHPKNSRAHKLYRKMGFNDWYMMMNKIIK